MSRLFFALWPTATTSLILQQNCGVIKSAITGNFVSNQNWHVTLAFLGEVNNRTQTCLINKANDIKGNAFSLTFDTARYFKKSTILSLGVNNNTINDDLRFLVQECHRIQTECKLVYGSRHYEAHITIARKVKKRQHELIIIPVIWPANDFVLVSSEVTAQGSIYTVLNRWSLMIT